MNTAIQFFGSTLFKLNLIPEYIAVLDYAASQGMVLPSDRKKQKDSNRLKKLIQEEVWDELDILYIFDQEEGRHEFATLNFKNPTSFQAYNDPMLFPELIPGSGFYSDGSQFLKTGFSPLSDAIHMENGSASILFSLFGRSTTEPTGGIAGCRTGNNSSQIFIANNSLSSMHWRLFHQGVQGNMNQQLINSSFITSRVSLSDQITKREGSIPVITSASAITNSGPLPDLELYVLARNENGVVADISTGGMKYFGIGSNLDDKSENIYNTLSN